jgi:glycosyltransferase involved in cell wall biosynthesis
MRFKIVTAVWNSVDWFQGCADSIASQDEPFDVIIIDDASTDGTAELMCNICGDRDWDCMVRGENLGVPQNHWTMLNWLRSTAEPDPDDVVVFVDGDDQLAPGALTTLRSYYEDPSLQLTYGQYRSEPFSPTCSLAGPYPQDVIDRRAYREHSLLGRGIPWNHLRTVRWDVISQLTEKDFQFSDGEWYRMSSDAAVMYPCLELAGDNFKFIPEVLYVYNSENPLSEWRKAPRDGDRVHQDVLHRKPKVPVTYEQTPEAIRLRSARRMIEQ